MQRARQIAIILPDILHSIGLHSLLSDYFYPVEVSYFPSFEQFLIEGNDQFEYYITDADQFVLNSEFFLPRKGKTIILVRENITNPGGHYINIHSTQETLLSTFRQIFAVGTSHIHTPDNNKDLSQREKDVLQLIVKGSTNKEIADKLSISLNTVLTHRKNITGKLGIKTISGLTYYAIMNGFISADDIDI
ncbi:MAG: LuxR C-terminal-related transcriptional regulator [Tannerellaceae bacterium]|nr:LuxR C-terminal-related transcriptional regulator [Tannerellaceae bacterium]